MSINTVTDIIKWMLKHPWGPALLIVLAIEAAAGLIIDRSSSTITGSMMGSDDSPAAGFTIVLRDSNGVEHKTVTGEDGSFEIHSVPKGEFVISSNDRLLIKGSIPSPWERILHARMPIGDIVYDYGGSITTPAQVPVPCASNDFADWITWQDDRGSSIQIGPAGDDTGDSGIKLSFNLIDGGWVGMNQILTPGVLTGAEGIRFDYKGSGAPNTLELKLLYEPGSDGTSTIFSALWWNHATATIGQVEMEVPFDQFTCFSGCEPGSQPDLARVWKVEFALSNKSENGDLAGAGTVIFDGIDCMRP